MRQEAWRPLTSRMHRSVSYECAARRRHASTPRTAHVTHLANLAVRHVVEPVVGPSALLSIHRAYAQLWWPDGPVAPVRLRVRSPRRNWLRPPFRHERAPRRAGVRECKSHMRRQSSPDDIGGSVRAAARNGVKQTRTWLPLSRNLGYALQRITAVRRCVWLCAVGALGRAFALLPAVSGVESQRIIRGLGGRQGLRRLVGICLAWCRLGRSGRWLVV